MSATELMNTFVPAGLHAHYDRMVFVQSLAPVTLTTLEVERICVNLRNWEKTWLVPLSASGSSSSSSPTRSAKHKAKKSNKPVTGAIPKHIPETEYFSAIVQLNSLISLVEVGLQNVDAELVKIKIECDGMQSVGGPLEALAVEAKIRKIGSLLKEKQVCNDAHT